LKVLMMLGLGCQRLEKAEKAEKAERRERLRK
jgi:hypothetical protein